METNKKGNLPHEMIPSESRPEDTRFAKLEYKDKVPKPPFTLLLVGPIGAGKSSSIYTMMNNWYKGYFDEIICYNGTMDSNDSWLNLPAKEVVVLNEWDEKAFFDYIKNLEKSQLKLIKDKKLPMNVAIVMDDMICDQIFARGRTTALDQMIVKIRHIPCSLIISTQSYKLVSTTARRNMTQIMLLPINQDEIEKVAEEHSGLATKDEFIKLYKSVVVKQPRNYMVIDYKAPVTDRFKERFDEVIPYSIASTQPKESKKEKVAKEQTQ